ncbi:MAG: dihydropteroate synthase [Verrucomicrobiia bacterium]
MIQERADKIKWQARGHRFDFPRRALVMGILNVTPDSFSDGGKYFDVSAAVDRAREMAAEGAEIVDIGGESSRPFATPVDEAEELRRVMPVIERLVGSVPVALSIDTRKPCVARAALEAGASIVNDIEANRDDPEMWEVVARYGAGYVCVHMQGKPENMQQNPQYADVVGEVGEFFEGRLGRLAAAGVAAEQVVLDPGIGFGKTVEHNLQLLAGLDSYRRFLRPLLIGVSRKSFIGRLLGVDVDKRLAGSLACAVWARWLGVEIVRAHDVATTLQALRMTEALLGERKR